MLIAAYDPDRWELRKLRKMLKKALPKYKFKFFTSEEKMEDYVRKNDVQIVFLEYDSTPFSFNTQFVVERIRRCSNKKLDIVITSEKEITNSMALWAINTQISDILRKPYTYEELTGALKHIWYHKIPEYDPNIKL